MNIDLTLDELLLTDCTINGVLNLYVVERKTSRKGNKKADSGLDAIFLNGDSWVGRYLSPLLSTSKLLVDIVSSISYRDVEGYSRQFRC